VRLNAYRKVWIDWLHRVCELPREHIALLLELELDVVDARLGFVDRRRGGRRRALPTGPPRCHRQPGDHVHSVGLGTRKIRVLRALGYSAEWIAFILAFDLADVRSFLARTTSIRGVPLAFPRSRKAQAALRAHTPRREPPPRPPVIDPADAWRYRDDVGADGSLVVLAPAAEAPHQAAAEIPPADQPAPLEAAAWEGAVNPHAGGWRKVSPQDAQEIRRLRSEGASTGELAKRFRVSRSWICAVINGEKPKVIDSPPLPCPERPSLHSLENP